MYVRTTVLERVLRFVWKCMCVSVRERQRERERERVRKRENGPQELRVKKSLVVRKMRAGKESKQKTNENYGTHRMPSSKI